MDIIKLRKLEGLAARRKACGYTQETFAEALGVQRAALAAWETLRTFPSAGILPAIADLLLCTVDDLYRAPEGNPPAAAAAAPFRQGGLEERADEGVGPYEEIVTDREEV